MASRLLYALVVGAVGAALIHVAVMLALPVVAARQAWRALESALPLDEPRRAGASALPVEPDAPFFRTVLCRFDLRKGPLRVSATGRAPFWTLAVFAADGSVLAGANSDMAGGGAPNLRIFPPGRMAEADGGEAYPLLADADAGVLALRVFVPDGSWEPLVQAMLESVACRPEAGAQ